MFRKRASGTRGDDENLTARWKTAHDICSLIACNLAFESSRDGETYDLGNAKNIFRRIQVLILIQIPSGSSSRCVLGLLVSQKAS